MPDVVEDDVSFERVAVDPRAPTRLDASTNGLAARADPIPSNALEQTNRGSDEWPRVLRGASMSDVDDGPREALRVARRLDGGEVRGVAVPASVAATAECVLGRGRRTTADARDVMLVEAHRRVRVRWCDDEPRIADDVGVREGLVCDDPGLAVARAIEPEEQAVLREDAVKEREIGLAVLTRVGPRWQLGGEFEAMRDCGADDLLGDGPRRHVLEHARAARVP